MGGGWANWRYGKLSTRRRAIRRYVLWPCCKPRWRRYVLWPCCKPPWRGERHVADRQGQVPAEAAAWDGSAPRPAENGCRRARASVGWRGTTYTWIRWRVTRRPRRWLGRTASRLSSRRSPTSSGSAASCPPWTPAEGTRIGWVAGNDLYLDPLASYQTAQALAGAERIPVSEQALRHQLRKCGFLASLDTGRGMLQVRRTLAGRPRQVLHLRASDWRAS